MTLRPDGVLTPNCPWCGHVGLMMPNVANAWCTGGDDCPIIMWDPYRPVAAQWPPTEVEVTERDENGDVIA